MKTIQKLFNNKLHIIGDIHGEYEALKNLLYHLGYDDLGHHPENYKLVFVGDLIDRGPQSPEVIRLVKRLVEHGNAQAIIGNHELNILQNKPKDGAGWFFEEQFIKDVNYHPFSRISSSEREETLEFLSSLPVCLENDELKIVHAAWDDRSIELIKNIDAKYLISFYKDMENDINAEMKRSGLLDLYHKEKDFWKEELHNPNAKVPFLENIAQYNLMHQTKNPVRVFTSGVEQIISNPFFAGGTWRFVERCIWWNSYEEEKPVIIGHFWRKFGESEDIQHGENIFQGIPPNSWHGKQNNVFCVDYSVGARFVERNKKLELGAKTKLAALSWPDRGLILENGERINTINFNDKLSKVSKFKL